MQDPSGVASAASTGLSNIATQGILGSLVVILIAVVTYQYVSYLRKQQDLIEAIKATSAAKDVLHAEKLAIQNEKLAIQEASAKRIQELQDAQAKRVLELQEANAKRIDELHTKHREELNTLSTKYQDKAGELQKMRVDDAQAVTDEAQKMLENVRQMVDVLGHAIDSVVPKRNQRG